MIKKLFLVFLMLALIVTVSSQAIADCGSDCASSCSGTTGACPNTGQTQTCKTGIVIACGRHRKVFE